ncbi:hypothetical protein [Lentzea sp. NPDC059081]|uniref:hypothetical protein n=1 Tax=Lentzea sp. NPDC059081 TaxID=3346719 RepID=UPI00368EBDD0
MDTGARNRTLRLAAFALAAVVVVGGVGFGVNYVWQISRGPTQASEVDCDLAQELIDRANGMPSDAAAAKALEADIRQARYSRFENDGISTEVGRYVTWKLVKATGDGTVPTREQYDEMVGNAQAHCRGERDLALPGYLF